MTTRVPPHAELLRVTVRTLSRWQTLWLLCRTGHAELALMLAIQFLREQLSIRRAA